MHHATVHINAKIGIRINRKNILFPLSFLLFSTFFPFCLCLFSHCATVVEDVGEKGILHMELRDREHEIVMRGR